MYFTQFKGDNLPQVICIESVQTKFHQHGLEELTRAFVRGQLADDLKSIRWRDYDVKVASCYLNVNRLIGSGGHFDRRSP